MAAETGNAMRTRCAIAGSMSRWFRTRVATSRSSARSLRTCGTTRPIRRREFRRPWRWSGGFEAGRLFEAEIFAELGALHPAAIRFKPALRPDRADVAAMHDGAALILGGQLPNDDVGRRVGKPDVLVRVERDR